MSAVMFGVRLAGRMARTEKMKQTWLKQKPPWVWDRRYVMTIRKFLDEMSKREILTKTPELRQLDGRRWERKFVSCRSWLSCVSGRKSRPFITWRYWSVSRQLDAATALSWQTSSC